MGCMRRNRPEVDIRPESKWDYISLNDFKSTSCWTPFAYTYLWLSLIISTAVYAIDTFTAVNLLAYGRWSSEVQLTQIISFDISKYIFSVCIILSFVNLGYEHIRAQRVMKRGSVAECFLDNLAVRLESTRFGKGKGWKRFLVFAELTKSKKGAEYVALFTYFSFQSWFRVILCSGPRQVINALTLYSFYMAKINASGTDVGNTLLDFINKIRDIASRDPQIGFVLSGMVFTVIVWIFAFMSLLMAFFFFVFFLWGYIPRADGGLEGYCSRKINKRLLKIVTIKVNKGIEDEERRRKKAEFKAAKKAGELPPSELKATLPDLGGGADSLPAMPMLHRNDTMTTLPPYTSRPGTPGSIELGAMDQKRPPMPSRSGTMASSTSSRAGLLGNAAEPGYGRSASPAPSIPSIHDMNNYPPARTATALSGRSFGTPSQLGRMNTNNSGIGGGYTASPATYASETMPVMPQPIRSPMGSSGYGGGGRASPAPSVGSYRGTPASPRNMISNNGPGYPMRSATGPVPPRGPVYPPQRNMTAPIHRQQPSNESYEYFNRPPTSSSQRSMPQPGYGGNAWNNDIESQRGPRY